MPIIFFTPSRAMSHARCSPVSRPSCLLRAFVTLRHAYFPLLFPPQMFISLRFSAISRLLISMLYVSDYLISFIPPLRFPNCFSTHFINTQNIGPLHITFHNIISYR